jgi:hypothetical protein
MPTISRRDFLKASGTLAAGSLLVSRAQPTLAFSANREDANREDANREDANREDANREDNVEVLHPRMRVPMSFIIDDSTCLVNMGRFCMPQFATAWPNRDAYRKPWRSWPFEIPDAFVREFGEWCAAQGVKGKYSVVPYPACVGWLDRELPGWSRKELLSSLKLVRELLVPNWDIHPEMITHTRVIDLKTGRPLREISAATMENSFPQTKISVDELASYLAYALRILKNCDLPCEGITTPGGFGNQVKAELPVAVGQSVRDVYHTEIPHYFKYIAGDRESTAPKVEDLDDAQSESPQLTMNVLAGTGDWFGGWDGDLQPQADRYCNREATGGRMVELIERNEPAVMLCHWPGMYTQGTKEGFKAFQQVVLALHDRFRDQTMWMKLSEMARYWAAKELTRFRPSSEGVALSAPFACPQFTVRIPNQRSGPPTVITNGEQIALRQVTASRDLAAGTWLSEPEATVLCFDLAKGSSELRC